MVIPVKPAWIGKNADLTQDGPFDIFFSPRYAPGREVLAEINPELPAYSSGFIHFAFWNGFVLHDDLRDWQGALQAMKDFEDGICNLNAEVEGTFEKDGLPSSIGSISSLVKNADVSIANNSSAKNAPQQLDMLSP